MRIYPKYAVIVRDGKGYPHDPSDEAKKFLESERSNGVYELEDKTIPNGTIIAKDEWKLNEKYRPKGTKDWRATGLYDPIQQPAEPNEEHRTFYQVY